jgi:hypothetical protein
MVAKNDRVNVKRERASLRQFAAPRDRSQLAPELLPKVIKAQVIFDFASTLL